MASGARRRPAILSGDPVFKDNIPITIPTLPSLDILEEQLRQIFSTGQLTNGKYVHEFEERCAEYLGSEHAVAVSSCTLGLILVLQALELKGEVLLPSFTFSASGHSLLWNNLRPVFIDCELDSHNINPTLIQNAITGQTSAVLAVDVFGNPCKRNALQKIAAENGLSLIMDCAHSFGSLYRRERIGRFADAQVYSLSPTKVIVAGEGGIISTNHADLAATLRKGRNYGDPGDYNCEFAGLNARMAEFNAILGLESLKMVEINVCRRNELVRLYVSRLKTIPGISFQKVEEGSRSAYKDFSILVKKDQFGLDRDMLAIALEAENVETRPYFNPPLHRQKAYYDIGLAQAKNLPNTEFLSASALSLPLYSHMPEKTVKEICGAIMQIHNYAEEIRER